MISKNDILYLTAEAGEVLVFTMHRIYRSRESLNSWSKKPFSRQGRENEFDEYDLNKGIQNSLLIARNDIKYHAEVSLDLGKIPVIHAMSSKVDQVLLNIILNASCAIRDKKTGEPGLIRIKTDIEGSFVRCRIEDNGTGIDKKYIGKVFDPFFTRLCLYWHIR